MIPEDEEPGEAEAGGGEGREVGGDLAGGVGAVDEDLGAEAGGGGVHEDGVREAGSKDAEKGEGRGGIWPVEESST